MGGEMSKVRVLTALLAVMVLAGGLGYGTPAQAQGQPTGRRFFPETGKTVQGRFLQYWEQNGGLYQQGFPLSDEAFRDSVRRLQLKAVERGLLAELQPTGEPLADAVERSRLRRDIHRGRHRPAGSPE